MSPISGSAVVRKPPSRSGLLDLFRLVWAYGVVQFHGGASGLSLALGSLPAFFIVLLQFSALRSADSSPWKSARSRFGRLMFPWLTWSALYAAGRMASAPTGRRLDWADPWMLLYGPVIHLWFLPAAFVLGCLFDPVARLNRRHPRLVMCAAALGGIAGLAALAALKDAQLPKPLGQWRVALFVFFLTPLLPCTITRSPDSRESAADRTLARTGLFIALGILLGAWIVLGMADLGSARREVLAMGLGILSAVVAMNVRTPSNAVTRLAGGAAFLVYLSHPAFEHILISWLHLDERADASVVLVFLVSLAFALTVNVVLGRMGTIGARVGLIIGASPFKTASGAVRPLPAPTV